jgi:hypothetical protein
MEEASTHKPLGESLLEKASWRRPPGDARRSGIECICGDA